MQTDSSAYDLPCCRSRLAFRRLQLMLLFAACLLLWPTPARSQPSPAASDSQLSGPACRYQQRLAGELRTLGELSLLDQVVTLQFESYLHDICSQITQAPLVNRSSKVQLVANAEEISQGEAEQDPCYVSQPLSSLSVNIAAPEGKMPEDLATVCRARTNPEGDRRLFGGWAMFEKHWAATGMHHRPLYFEEVNAERYGYTPGHCIQPIISAGRFVATIPALPYLMVASPPCRCVYTLGHYRPGDCVPYRWHRPPCSVAGGAFETAVVVGLVALIP